MAKCQLLFCSLTVLSLAHGYRILGIFPSHDRNNYLTYRGLFRELANRNHEVTLISHFELPNAPATYNDVLLSENQVFKGLSFESVIVSDVSRVPFETLVLTKAGNDDCKVLMNNNRVLHMIRTRPKFDVILVESYNSDCGLALAANLSAPYIAFSPNPLQPWQYPRAGVEFSAAHVPQAGLPYGREPGYPDRLRSWLSYQLATWVYYVGSQVTDHVFLYKYLSDDLPPLETVSSNASLLFVNTHQSVFGGFCRADNVIDIGGIHVRPPKIIPTEIERFMNEAEHGVLYANLGSTLLESTLPADKLDALLAAFGRLRLRVLWKWDGPAIDRLPRNVMTMRWLPQYDILKHGNVKGFLSHAGVLSALEAVDAGVPVVAVPLFGAQHGTAAALRDAGIAAVVPYQDLDKDHLLDAINDILDDKWQQRAKLVSRLWHDRPMSPLETAVYWTEYVARYQGAPGLQPTSARTPAYQRLQLDVLACVALVMYVFAYVTYRLLAACCGCCRNETDITTVPEEERRTRRVKFE